ncbi:MAG TPA: hypothetical protein VNN12_01565 [Dehalococcoidia bacterium]|nr:hypothetical protein [Dehalococcoidia bacterium]
MALAVWSYVPTRVVEETIAVAAAVTAVSPGTQVGGSQNAQHVGRRWVLEHSHVTSADVAGMFTFVASHRGAWQPFLWRSPVDSVEYLVRFAADAAAPIEPVFVGPYYDVPRYTLVSVRS